VANHLQLGNTGFAGVLTNRVCLALLAAATALLLAACGGGGASAPPSVGGALQVQPGITDMFANTPVTFTISGGQRPYQVFSSNSSVLPLNLTVSSGSTFTATANNPTADTPITITVRDAAGASTTSAATVRATILLNEITVRNSFNNGNNCGGANVCSGSEALVSVTIRQNGSPVVGRSVRFEVVSGSVGVVASGQAAQSVTATTDTLGVAIATLRAPVSVTSQYAVLRIVDVPSGQNANHVVTLGQTVDPTAIQITPNNFQWTGAFNDSCASNVLTSHLVTGGTPPYTVRQSIPNFATLLGSPIVNPATLPAPPNGTTLATNGGSVLVNVTGQICSVGANGNTITVTDAIGRVATFNIGNALGTAVRPAPGAAITLPAPTLTTASFTGVACGVSYSTFVSQTIPAGYTGTAPVLSVVALEPLRIDAQLTNGILTVTRRVTDPGGAGSTSVRVFNGVSFSDLSLALNGTAPFACVTTTGTPISLSTTSNLTVTIGAPPSEVTRTAAVTISGGTAPFTVTSINPATVQVSLTGVTGTYANTVTIAAGSTPVYFARGLVAGLAYITITDSSTPPQTSIQVVTVNP
jgi:hypothetical protein